MENSTTIALSRLIAQQRAMDVTANNLANANTPGYKAERVQFSDWLSRQTHAATPPGGRTIAYTQDRATWRDQQEGTLTHTANPLDIAVTGDGFFTVNTPNGPRLTRDGHFGLGADGSITDQSGNRLLDTNGQPIQLAPGDTDITVAADGTVTSTSGQIGKIGIVRPTDPMRVVPEGGVLLRADSATAPVAAPKLEQGAVEDSNVQGVVEMTRMMNDMREFQFVSQFVQAEADREQSVIDKILTPQA